MYRTIYIYIYIYIYIIYIYILHIIYTDRAIFLMVMWVYVHHVCKIKSKCCPSIDVNQVNKYYRPNETVGVNGKVLTAVEMGGVGSVETRWREVGLGVDVDLVSGGRGVAGGWKCGEGEIWQVCGGMGCWVSGITPVFAV